jgi:prepilin-type N-terminal cleavage/methylation domain-containing protein
MRTPTGHPGDRQAGFTLLELLAAITLFALIVVGFSFATKRAFDQAGRANDARILRYLAGYQMGYLRLGVNPSGDEYDLGEDGGDFGELDAAYANYTWSVNIEEVVVAGQDLDDEVPNLFEDEEDPLDEDEEEEEGEPIKLLRITLIVTPPEGTEEESLTLVTFKPLPREAEGEGEGG